MSSNKRFYRLIPNLAFLSLIIIGVAAGMLFNATVAGTLIGTGAGFIVMAVVRFASVKKNQQPDIEDQSHSENGNYNG